MNYEKCRFDQCIPRAARELSNASLREWDNIRFIRDLTGQLYIVVPDSVDQRTIEKVRKRLSIALGPYSPGVEAGLVRICETLSGEALFDEPVFTIPFEDKFIFLIDRRAIGQDWSLKPAARKLYPSPSRFVFYSIKGGVGRSSALIMTGRRLAALGKQVLLIDCDLEAPGLGALLLPQDARPRFGVLDWLVEDIVGAADDDLMLQMYAQTPAVDDPGIIVIPAVGEEAKKYPDNVIAKLARAYLETSGSDSAYHYFAYRLDQMIGKLEQNLRPDVVLIDSRAGLHETAAATLLHLGAFVFLFAVDLPSTWEGYRYLFGHLKQLAQFGETAEDSTDWRENLSMVHARASGVAVETEDFISNSFGVWTDTLYDMIPADSDFGTEFSFDQMDETAPHWPYKILLDPRFERFNFLENLSGVSQESVDNVFGEIFKAVFERIEESQND